MSKNSEPVSASLLVLFEPPSTSENGKKIHTIASTTHQVDDEETIIIPKAKNSQDQVDGGTVDTEIPLTPFTPSRKRINFLTASEHESASTSVRRLFDVTQNATKTESKEERGNIADEYTPLMPLSRVSCDSTFGRLDTELQSQFNDPYDIQAPVLIPSAPLNSIFSYDGKDDLKQNGHLKQSRVTSITDQTTPKFGRNLTTAFGGRGWPPSQPHCEDLETGRDEDTWKTLKSSFIYCCDEVINPSTWIGASLYLLFHNVYCLTMGAAIIRPNNVTSIVGPMTKMAALGIIIGSPVFWRKLHNDFPSLYPSVDLFAAPFLANIAVLVDTELFNDPSVSEEDNDQYFLATFTFLVSLSLTISGTLLIMASVFKLANIGAYLPFPVLCGFFGAVGVLTWTLAFKVDTNGKSVDQVFFSNDWNLILKSLIHHIPSLFLGATMKYLGPKHPFYLAGIVLSIIGMFYLIMYIFGISMESMVSEGWFWSSSDLHYEPNHKAIGLSAWSTPAPCGWIYGLVHGRVHWKAVGKGLDTCIALGVLYLIRCSLHAAALKKNVSNLVRKKDQDTQEVDDSRFSNLINKINHRRRFSEFVDLENMNKSFCNISDAEKDQSKALNFQLISAKPTNVTLKDMLLPYGLNQYVGALIGSFGVVPSISATSTMYSLRAEKLAPQLGSIAMLSALYLTDFNLVGFIPKTAFSSMLVLASVDMIYVWGIKSYFKTKEKIEWLVVPLIVVFAFVVGLLQSVFLGIAVSTFLFVASFFRSGVVKYISNGLNIRSTIERPMKITRWLNQNAEKIQILVLQNYLFFGNASSILSYIASMFDEPPTDSNPLFVPPKPKIIILDLTLVTGMDTSAVDVFSDILNQCKTHKCRLFLCGVSNSLRQVMSLCGVKPESTLDRSERMLRFFSELDAAIGKAEDMLIDLDAVEDDLDPTGIASGGFRHALKLIDREHSTNIEGELIKLEEYTEAIDVEAGEVLYRERDMDRGLFFIEFGIMKIERNSDFTFSRVAGNEAFNQLAQNGTLNAVKFRSQTIGKEIALMKAGRRESTQNVLNSRLARVGPGWILGLVEVLSGSLNTGRTIAVTKCRLHYISYTRLLELETKEPAMTLNLYKLLSYLMAKRQESTIAQLGTLQSIMSAIARK